MMSDFNHKQYQSHYQQYLESNSSGKIGGENPHGRVALIKRFLPKGRKVLEIGSGGGMDAILLEEAGYDVTASDYAENFVEILEVKGLKAIKFDAKHDEIPATFDAIYANAVFVHFSPDEITDFLIKTKPHLANEKIIFLSLIKGHGSERSVRERGFERDFHYYSLSEIEKILEGTSLTILYKNDQNEKWIQVVAQL